MTRTTLALLVLIGCAHSPPRPPDPFPWLTSSAIDARTRESLASLLPWNLALPFDVTLARPLTAAERASLEHAQVHVEGDGTQVRVTALPASLGPLFDTAPVTGLSCPRAQHAAPESQDWQARVNAEAIHLWTREARCYLFGYLALDGALSDHRADLEALGVLQSGYEHGGSVGVLVPHDALPALVMLPFVHRFEIPPEPQID